MHVWGADSDVVADALRSILVRPGSVRHIKFAIDVFHRIYHPRAAGDACLWACMHVCVCVCVHAQFRVRSRSGAHAGGYGGAHSAGSKSARRLWRLSTAMPCWSSHSTEKPGAPGAAGRPRAGVKRGEEEECCRRRMLAALAATAAAHKERFPKSVPLHIFTNVG
jgi:hypothetical protein